MSDRVVLFNSNLLAQELEEVVDWDRLGMHLGLNEKEIREIELNHQESVSRKRMAMLDKWTRKQGHASWEMVIEALEKMSERRLANELRGKYCAHPNTALKDDEKPIASEKPKTSTSEGLADLQETERVVTVDYRRHAVARELENIRDRHFELVKKIESAVESAKPSSRDLKRFSMFQMTNGNEVTSVEELFDHVEPYFLDYALLEKIVKFLLERDHAVVSELNDYIRDLEEFKKSCTLKQLMESIETAQQPLTATESAPRMCTVTLKLVGGWLEKTISDLKKLLKVLFQDKASVLSHLTISPGSVIITYLTPLSEVDGLIKIAQDQVPVMLQVGVCALMIGDTVVAGTQSVRSRFSFESSLIKAVIYDNINVLRFLLDINTNPNAADAYGQTALLFGISYGKSKAVRLLLEANADHNLLAAQSRH